MDGRGEAEGVRSLSVNCVGGAMLLVLGVCVCGAGRLFRILGVGIGGNAEVGGFMDGGAVCVAAIVDMEADRGHWQWLAASTVYSEVRFRHYTEIWMYSCVSRS